jgi:hypothetical protein
MLSITMHDEDLSKFGPNGRSVSAILNQAAAMSLDEMAALAASNDSMTGYFGRRKAWLEAQNAAQGVARSNSRLAIAASASDRAMDCVISATQRLAAANGKDADRIADSWRRYRSAVADGGVRRRRRAFSKFQRVLRRTIGLKFARQVPVASGAVSSAVQVAVIWDLANDRSPFTREQRDLLMTPWMSVFPLPQELSD